MFRALICVPFASFIFAFLSTVTGTRAQNAPLILSGEIEGVHDPFAIAAGSEILLFSTAPEGIEPQISVRCSSDLQKWSQCGYVFDHMPSWATREINGATRIWAPGVFRVKGEYRLYYSVSTFGRNDSAIGMAVNKKLDPSEPSVGWQDCGIVLRSHSGVDDWNAIDPNMVTDENNQEWLVFGSYWGGIKMRKLDTSTGLLDQRDTHLYSLAERPRNEGQPGAIEAPYVLKHGGFYYLLASFDFCCAGMKSTYYIGAGRASKLNGPYRDAGGKPMLQGGATILVSSTPRWGGPGHAAVLQYEKKDYLVYQAYDSHTEKATLRIAPLNWIKDWPVATNLQ